jgi:hypothetical protein
LAASLVVALRKGLASMDAHRGILVPRMILAVLLAWVVTVLEVAVPAYAVGGLGELRNGRGMEWRKDRLHATGAARQR